MAARRARIRETPIEVMAHYGPGLRQRAAALLSVTIRTPRDCHACGKPRKLGFTSPSKRSAIRVMTPSDPPPNIAERYAESYHELRRLARAQLSRHQRTGALDTTSLVHESFLRFSKATGDIQDRRHFMGYAAKVMRSVIVDFARARNAERRGGDFQQTTLNSEIMENVTLESGVLKIDEALNALEGADPRLAQIVELRFFAGLSAEEAAEVIGVSERTLFREWEKARLILADAIRDDA